MKPSLAVTNGRAPTQSRAKATVSAILEAAEQLMRDQPFAAVRMRDIGKRAGVAQGTLYEYFPTKRHLEVAVEARTWWRISERVMTTVMSVRGGPLVPAIRAVVETTMAAIFEETRDNPIRLHGRGVFEKRNACMEQIADFLVPVLANRKDELRSHDLRQASRMVIETVAMLSGYATWTHPEGIRDGSYAREVGIMIAAYLVRSSADG